MTFHRAKDFNAAKAWDALDIAQIEGASVRLHWSDAPYIWHENEGEEVFVVLDGRVIMKTRSQNAAGDWMISETMMEPGDIYHAATGDSHVAHPQGAARMLVIEKIGSL